MWFSGIAFNYGRGGRVQSKYGALIVLLYHYCLRLRITIQLLSINPAECSLVLLQIICHVNVTMKPIATFIDSRKVREKDTLMLVVVMQCRVSQSAILVNTTLNIIWLPTIQVVIQ